MQAIRTRTVVSCAAMLLSIWAGAVFYHVLHHPAAPPAAVASGPSLARPRAAPVDPWAALVDAQGETGMAPFSSDLSLTIRGGQTIEEPTWFERWRQRLIDAPAQWISLRLSPESQAPDDGFFP